MSEKKNRIHPNLLVTISDHFSKLKIPTEYAAPITYGLLANSVCRKLYLFTETGYFWLSGFRFLVGGPGTGKSIAINFMQSVIKASELKIPIAPQSMSKASFIDDLAAPVNRVQMGLDAADVVTQLAILASEYTVLMGEHVGKDMLQTMCVIGDGESYKETRRSIKEPPVIENPFVDMVAGVQPMRMKGQFPKEAWFAGFTSRSDFFFGEAMERGVHSMLPAAPPRFNTESKLPEIVRTLAHDMQCIYEQFVGKLAVQVGFTEDGIKRLTHWYQVERKETEYTHPWLQDQNVRRFPKLVRDASLCMLARSANDLRITAEDIDLAWSIIHPNEMKLVPTLDRIHKTDAADVAEQIYLWALHQIKSTKLAITKADLSAFCMTKQSDAWKVEGMIKYLVTSEMFVEKSTHTDERGIKHTFDTPVYYPNPGWKKP